MSDYYKVLGVTKDTPKDEIKKAFRKLAHKYHPDKGSGDDKKFKEINEAYQTLSNDKKRAEYDAYGRVFSDGTGGGPAPGWGGAGFNGGQGIDFDLGDIFENIFSGQGQATRTKRGRDISIDLELSFEEAVFGVERRVLLSKTSFCEDCKSTGAEEGSKTENCPTCKGSGKIHEAKRSFLGTFTSLRECIKCAGRGTVPTKKCKKCKGYGVLTKNEDVEIKIPAGIQHGEMIKLSGMGEAVSNGVAGDLYVQVRVRPHANFKREGNNLTMNLDIKLSEAILGAKIDIETLDGIINLTVPAGINSGEILRVKGKGVPHQRGGRGDLMVRVIIKTPRKISRHIKKIIEELKKEGL